MSTWLDCSLADIRPPCLSAYIRWSDSCNASDGVAASAGKSARPCAAVTAKPSPWSASARTAPATMASASDVLRAQDAELVAAHPVRRAAAGDEAGELLAQPGEQHVAGGMAEEIVVLLEAVEVEQGEDVGRLALDRGLQVVEQLPSVSQTGERIGASLVARAGEHLHVLPERHRETREDRQDGRRRERRGTRD